MVIPAMIEAFASDCRRGGLDLTYALSLDWLEEALIDPWRPPGFRRDALGILVGNTRALWPAIRQAWRRRGPSAHPVDEWCESVVTEAAQQLDAEVALRSSHRRYASGYLPLQRIAHQAGFVHLSPSHLSIHPDHGPWVALRYLVIVDHPGLPGPPPVAPDPCAGCDQPCVTALDLARRRGGRLEEHGVEGNWRDWVAVRDACPVGRPARYDDAQIAYHYAKDRRGLDTEEPGD